MDNGKIRCPWAESSSLMQAYHDSELGRICHDDQYLFEMLTLEGAQAGLSWQSILQRREGYRQAFHRFQIHKVAEMTDEELEALRENPGIIRNRLKIYSVRKKCQGGAGAGSGVGQLRCLALAFYRRKAHRGALEDHGGGTGRVRFVTSDQPGTEETGSLFRRPCYHLFLPPGGRRSERPPGRMLMQKR